MRKLTPLQPDFTFAGFTWPRYVADMACGPSALRAKRDSRKLCGNYYHAPRPNANDGKGFYLESEGQPAPRYFTTGCTFAPDECTEIEGLVLRLPHGRFLAGWTMGVHMASGVDARLFDDEGEAIRAANNEAERVAEEEAQRAYEESEGAQS